MRQLNSAKLKRLVMLSLMGLILLSLCGLWFYETAIAVGLLAGLILSGLTAGLNCRWRTQKDRVDDSRSYLLQILEKAPIGALLNDSNGHRLYVNPFWQELTGLSIEQAGGQGWQAAIHPDDLARVLVCWDRVIQRGETVELEYRFIHTGGQINWVRGALLPLRNDADAIVAYIGVMADITPLKNQESIILAGRQEVERAHEELNGIFNSSSDPIVGIDMNFRFTIFNIAYSRHFNRLYGVEIREHGLLPNELANFPEDKAIQIALWSRAMQGESLATRHTFGDSNRERRTFDLSLNPQYDSQGTLTGAVMIMRDVTISARVEEALLRSEELFRSATESSLDAIVVLEAVSDAAQQLVDFKVLECNQIALDVFHRRRVDSMGILLSRIMPMYRMDGLFDSLRKVYELGISHEEDRQVVEADGSEKWMQYQAVAISNGLTLTIRNITERKMHEHRLFESESRIATILASVQIAIVTLDEAGLIRSANPACGRIFDYLPMDLIGKPLSILFPQIARSLPSKGLVSTLHDDLGVEQEVASIAQGITQHGKEIPVEISCKEILFGKEQFYAATLHDITEHRTYEARLQQNITELELLREDLNKTNDQLSNANRELSRLAHLDGLTGLPNRRYLDQTLQAEWARCAREGNPLSIIILDVDHFKRYNDSYGHQTGDGCLKLIASSIKRGLHRAADFAARYGGEEFVLILPNTDKAGAERVALDVLEDVRSQAIPHANSPTAAWVTISAGIVSNVPKTGEDVRLSFSRADQALYQAKQNGRDRVVADGHE